MDNCLSLNINIELDLKKLAEELEGIVGYEPEDEANELPSDETILDWIYSDIYDSHYCDYVENVYMDTEEENRVCKIVKDKILELRR